MSNQDMPNQVIQPPLPPQVPYMKPKKRFRWVKWVVLGIVVSCIALAVYLTVKPRSPMNINSYIGMRSGYSNTEIPAPKVEQWFDTLEEAMAAEAARLPERRFVSEPIAEVPYEGGIARLYFLELENGATEFSVYRFPMQDGKYAPPPAEARYAFTDLTMQELYARNIYADETERVSQYLEHRFSDNLFNKKDVFAYYGVSKDPRIEDMTVLGMHPDEVIEYTYQDTTYYFWYYNFDFVGYLEKHPDFSFGGFTLNQIIDVLEIKTVE